MRVVVVVGNPKPQSRTLAATVMVARRRAARAAQMLVVGSPTFKAAYSGILKMFLDQFPADGLLGVTAFPVMVGGNPAHALAPELSLKPLLSEMGASCPAPGFYFVGEAQEDDPRFLAWLARAKPLLPK